MLKKLVVLTILIAGTSVKANWNIKIPTIGGKLFWTDVKILQGWRIQENVITGHFRLLNPNKVRYEWGSKELCQKEMLKHTSSGTDKKTVVLIHGLGLRKESLKCLVPILEKEGYQTVQFGYSAMLEKLETCADKLNSVLSDYDGEIYVVSHSMGGILMRQYQQKFDRQISKIVMLAPPNRGARIVDSIKNFKISGLLGVNGKRLHTGCNGLPLSLPSLKAPFITISGKKKDPVGYFPLLCFMPEDNDGVISQETTRLENELYHVEVDAYHLNIMKNETVQNEVINFFRK